MPPTLSLFSPAASEAMDETDSICGAGGGTTMAFEVKPKGRRGGKPPGPKKPPQRGLGVEKLERLRLQERWKMMTETESPVPVPIYDLPALFRFSCAWMESQSVPLQGTLQDVTKSSSVPLPSPAMMYMPSCRTPIAVGAGGYGALPAVRSAAHDHYSLDRFQLGTMIQFQEPPSNQIPAPCFSDQCEFCVCKKRLLGGYPGQERGGGSNVLGPAFSMTSDETKISGENLSRAPRETVLTEHNFFPVQTKRAASAAYVGNSESPGDSSSATGCSPGFLDLTLRLSS
ncbi:hypothetical protein AXF42_Ash011022 [Apostasia shenzhenica]|uniref:Uncharacterized protein n=1 Tax=Apostasia shenzhenica TaxID=1088818 RepID=A0A2H9ZQW7_9ASPA|nr:hypothetical protein AXF42_Ash011022 [Apostasia shenzhenica]